MHCSGSFLKTVKGAFQPCTERPQPRSAEVLRLYKLDIKFKFDWMVFRSNGNTSLR